MLAFNGVTHAFLHDLKGLWYDPLESNEELQDACPAVPASLLSSSGAPEDPPESVVCFPVCTVNPLEGLERARQVVLAGLARGARFWRLYPQEQQWSVGHPVCNETLHMLQEARCCLMLDASPGEIEAILQACGAESPVVSSLHFYDSADWELRLRHRNGFYLTTRNLHGPGSVARAARHFADRLVYCSGAPFGSPAASLGLVEALDDTLLRRQILAGNALSLIERVYRGR